MNKSELITQVTSLLKDNEIGKRVKMPAQTFCITDGEGASKIFKVQPKDKLIMFTADDIGTILDAFIYTVVNTLSENESVNIRSILELSLTHVKPAHRMNFATGKVEAVPGHYKVKAKVGKDLNVAAKRYEMYLNDKKYTIENDFDEYKIDTDSDDEEEINNGDCV